MNTLQILKHIEELYGTPSTIQKIDTLERDQPTLYEAWTDAFKEYDLADVLSAIDEYWVYKSDKTRPTVAKIKALLHNTEKLPETTGTRDTIKGDYAVQRMASDTETGVCRNNLYVYKDAERLILEDWLMQEIPASIWAKLDYSARIKQAEDKGLLSRFDEALSICAQKRFGRAFEFTSKEDNKTLNADKTVTSLASHWRM